MVRAIPPDSYDHHVSRNFPGIGGIRVSVENGAETGPQGLDMRIGALGAIFDNGLDSQRLGPMRDFLVFQIVLECSISSGR